ncbi:MAG: amidohydrolase family protein [Planctomycetota bacterium]
MKTLAGLILSFTSGLGTGQEPPAASPAKAADDKQWDVAAAHGPVDVVELDTDAGTWMSCDVSPDGHDLVFDLLGDIYIMPIGGGEARALKTGAPYETQPRFSPDGQHISFTSDRDGGDNVWVMDRDGEHAHAVTKEVFRLLNNAVWTPDGQYLIARKHFTSRRSLGAGEMWMYHVSGGDGAQLTTRRNDQQDAGEPEVSPDGRYLYYSEDVSAGGAFEYNRDPNGVIYVIQRVDLRTREASTLIARPGGAVRPEISPDGRTLAYVRRARTKTVLCLRDLASGRDRDLFDGLSQDSQETWSIFGVHPGFAWTADGKRIVISAQGKFMSIEVATGEAQAIPFRAHIRQEVTRAVRFPQAIGGDQLAVRVIRWPAVAPDGKRVVFHALGHLYQKDMPQGDAQRLTSDANLEFMPQLSSDGRSLVYVTWHDRDFGSVRVQRSDGQTRTLTPERGHYASPSFSADGQWVVFTKTGGDLNRGELYGENPGVYRVPVAGGAPIKVCERGSSPRFDRTGQRILLLDRESDNAALVSVSLEGQDRRVLATSALATEMVLSPDERFLAFRELFQAYVCRFPQTGRALAVSADMKAVPVKRLTRDCGNYLAFSSDSTKVYHQFASQLCERRLADLFPDPFAVRQDAPKAEPQEGAAKEEDHEQGAVRYELGFTVAADAPQGDLALVGARLITMRGDEVIEDGVIHVQRNRIVAVGKKDMVSLPPTTRTIDVSGKTIMPGLVDVHAHVSAGSGGIMPQLNWPYLANLAFGVTTTHDPSNDTEMVFSESELVTAGLTLGPRIFSTGTILYGAEGSFKAVINSYQDALSHLRRLKAYGAFSVKSYNQPRRNQRQQVIKAARELSMMVVPEGGSTFFHNMTEVLDGHTTIEHAIPVAPLYQDVVALMAHSGTAYTPTLIVGYGGLWGENYWYQKTEVWKNERLLKFVPRSVVDPRARRRTMAPDDEFHHIVLARTATELARAGVNVELGAHGQMQGIGPHWELWMLAQGGMSPLEVIRAGTLAPAKALGLDQHIGSLEPGKLADLVVLDRDPLADIQQTESVRYVMANGRLYDAMTLDQIAPEAKPLAPRPELE